MLTEVLSAGGKARVIKETPAKLVTLHSTSSGQYYVKRYRNQGLGWRALKFVFKESHARREWRLAHAIGQRGVAVVRHVAVGERRSRWGGVEESVLISESFPGLPICEYNDIGAAVVQAGLGRFMRGMHDAGVLQFDLFANILIDPRNHEFRRIDVHHAELRAELTKSERVDNLAFLGAEVPLTDALFETYGWGGIEAERTRIRSLELRREFYARRARRCFRKNADFEPGKIGRLRCWLRKGEEITRVVRILEAPDDFFEKGQPLKRGRSATVAAGDGFVVKRFNLRRISNLAKNCFRSSRARLAFHRAYHLELAGVRTSKGLAAADLRVGPFLLRSYFVMEQVPGAQDISQFSGDLMRGAELVAELLAKLHNEGFWNRDLKETNILFDRGGLPWLIDLEGLRYAGKVSHKRAAADIGRLLEGVRNNARITRRHRAHFLRVYCRTRGIRPRVLRG